MNDFLSPFLSDGLVIQRDASFPVWSRKRITVVFLGKTYESKSVNGKFLIMLDPACAGGPFTMDISSDDEKVTIRDIYSGDVWLCAGQSNMELMMQRLRDDFSEEWDDVNRNNIAVNKSDINFSLIRQFKVPQQWDFAAVRDDFSGGCWQKAAENTLHEFSGTAWFFAKEMHKKYRVPVGLLMTAWGGTPIESWMSKEALADFPEKTAEGMQYADAAVREETVKNAAFAIQEWEQKLLREDSGIKNNWKDPGTDIREWEDITLPGDFADSGIKSFCGIIWLAKDIEIPADFAEKDAKIWLGTIVDSDTVYVNGTEVGNTGYRYPPRKYPVKKGILKPGKNRITIRVICNNGEGGFTRDKHFSLFADNQESRGAEISSQPASPRNFCLELAGTWKRMIGCSAQTRPGEFFFQRLPFGNYNAMIAPVLKYPLKGVIWYQGESNDSSSGSYAQMFTSMIQDWREKNGCSGLPFFFVQLPIWKEISDNDENSSWAAIREAQKAALSLPATGMAAALELGEWNDLHPLNKKGVGIRLFLAADRVLYGAENSSPGPTVKGFNVKDGKLHISFDNCADGLYAKDTAYVSVLCDEGQIRAPVAITGKDVISADLSAVSNPKKILYAWADNPRDRQLFNSAGLPAIPFRIILT
ncbi:MAG: hypothetical protein LBH16_09075 [Treponema sp.]|jgi:sialate O-acetylesterase|nr:hypothetical protein [Treponema sp.]